MLAQQRAQFWRVTHDEGDAESGENAGLQGRSSVWQSKIPLLNGGSGEKKTLCIAAQYADTWHSHGDPATFRHKVAVLHDWCARVGRNPGEIECAVSPFFGMRPVNTHELGAYVEAGATHFILDMSRPTLDMPWNFERMAQLLEWRNRRRG